MKESEPQKISKRREYLIVVLLAILFIAAVVLGLRQWVNDNSFETDQIGTSGGELVPEVLLIEDNSKAQVGEVDIVFPAGWSLSGGFASTKNTIYDCKASGTCRFFTVGMNDLPADFEIIISTPQAPVTLPTNAYGDLETLSLTVQGETAAFTVRSYQYGTSEGEITSGIAAMLYGCNSKACFASTLLSEDVERNTAQIEEFKSFLARI